MYIYDIVQIYIASYLPATKHVVAQSKHFTSFQEGVYRISYYQIRTYVEEA